MYVYTDEHIERHVLLCFATLFVIKMLLLLLKGFYNETGLFGKITEDVLIKVFKELNFVITKDLITNEIIKNEKLDNNSFNNSWNLYDNIQSFLKIYSKFL
ncbi:hypothetical protein [Mycoplasmopsis felis]|uniref:hypothetical protein n=1 Tax=Mycoplasmopsis felis TaxID=33923 RepID=UPI002AF6B235|nr:hypothetical protein [Mycoplasmopsis felis]WQQ02371.1 hypothetical protein RNN91_03545 [Mycoplasmopsis felis]WQQ08323.1 hypothetical protein RRG61_03290 [Mycoplasmopsis felis]WQQ10317.1 hypothetical protein RRG49_01075 [Mycoplasmopsis felis]WRX06407.1 hypothetical protein O7984_02620 [Mycoplasmopsis felis]